MSSYRPKGAWLPLALVGGVLAVVLAMRLGLQEQREFDPDEFQHLHCSWCISHGMLPYRDYFEHHVPGFHYLLAPLCLLPGIDTDPSAAVGAVLWARRLMWLFTVLALLLTYRLGRLWGTPTTASVGVFLLATTLVFHDKTIEVRPDVPALLLLLSALILVVLGVREVAGRRTVWLFLGSGLCLGLGLVFTQKYLFALPGMGLAMVWYLLDPRGLVNWRRRVVHGLVLAVGLVLPLALILAYFAWHGALGDFLEHNLFLNLRWKAKIPADKYIVRLIQLQPFLVPLGLAGLARYAAVMFQTHSVRRGDYILILNTIGLIAALAKIPVPYPQYFLTFLPLLAVLGGLFLTEALEALADLCEGKRGIPWSVRLGQVLLAVSAAAGLIGTLAVARPRVGHNLVYPVLLIGTVVAGAVLLWYRRRELALALVLIPLSLYPLSLLRHRFEVDNRRQLDELRYVIANTAPTETVLDGFSGQGVFRPHAYYYFFVHPEVRLMLSEEELHQLLDDLQSGAIRPKLVVLDEHLAGLSPAITDFLQEHYEPVPKSSLRRLREELPSRAQTKQKPPTVSSMSQSTRP
jgi:4-amino-4-deoxy-L-arabinose transferase-like glycosyltransferase